VRRSMVIPTGGRASKCKGKWPDQPLRTAVRAARGSGSHPHRQPGLSERGKSAKIRATSGVIRGIPVVNHVDGSGKKNNPFTKTMDQVQGVVDERCWRVITIWLMGTPATLGQARSCLIFAIADKRLRSRTPSA
jgi:hypothetical protein